MTNSSAEQRLTAGHGWSQMEIGFIEAAKCSTTLMLKYQDYDDE
jgi:hypothetical protein